MTDMGATGDPFAPLGDNEVASARRKGSAQKGTFTPQPVMGDVEPPEKRHPKLGLAKVRYRYRNADGGLEGFICRDWSNNGTFTPKEPRPLRFGAMNGGELGDWYWRGWGDDRPPLYRVPELLAAPELPVLVVEGEKTADAAAQLLAGEVAVITSMNGAASPGKTDWKPLQGRDVVIWPDHDAEGANYARSVARLALAAGAASVRVIELPLGLPEKWDLADALPDGMTVATVRELIAAAPAFVDVEAEEEAAFAASPHVAVQPPFMVVAEQVGERQPGVYRYVKSRHEGDEASGRWVRFGSLLVIEAETRNDDGAAWGRLLTIHDRDGRAHDWAMPMHMMAGSGEAYRGELLLANGGGKRRMTANTAAQPQIRWRVLFLSSGEVGLRERLAEIGKQVTAGQGVRLIELPGNAGAGLGVFEELHELEDGAELAEHLRAVVVRQCGTAGRAFLIGLTADLERHREHLRKARERFVAAHVADDAVGQVRRVAGRFGMVAAAGELAIALGVLPWAAGTAEQAVLRLLEDWLAGYGAQGDVAEVTEGINAVRLFLELHKTSRFERAWARADHMEVGDEEAIRGEDESAEDFAARQINRDHVEANMRHTINSAGYRRLIDARWHYFITAQCWVREVCKGRRAALVARAMVDKGFMEADAGGKKTSQSIRVPGYGQQRVYVVLPALLGDDA